MLISPTPKFELDQKVSSHLAFILILLLSCMVAWFSVTTAQEVVKNSEESASFNIEKRIKINNVNNKPTDLTKQTNSKK